VQIGWGVAAGLASARASRAGEAASGTSVTFGALIGCRVHDRLPTAATGSAVPPKRAQPATAAARNGATSCAGVAGCPPDVLMLPPLGRSCRQEWPRLRSSPQRC